MRVTIDELSGFCFGVVRAISRAEEALAEGGEVFSLGDIVHNRIEVQRLEGLGLKTITHDQIPTLKHKRLFIRAHGEPPSTYQKAEEQEITLIDATCPVVASLQRRVKEAYDKMEEVAGQVVILGKRGHAEVVGLTGQVADRAIVVERLEDLNRIDFSRPIHLLSQTTQSIRLFEEVAREIRRRAADPDKVRVDDTICRRVANREEHLRSFSQSHDLILFVAGRKSSNGKVLFEVCHGANPACHLIEEPSEIDPEWLKGVESVGICGATSTPGWLMQQVAEQVKRWSAKE